ncbi:helix-turn-helix transcriptional regulator [Cognaticolwellia mytili]|uniref:helix-turn-helix transcriptional regulator n=1 Tax=Cognaticolwellia mytili TaxID=1888913 RepID=UPI000A170916|nr:response regulator transcription factor [Cognaticolwellia mytili]
MEQNVKKLYAFLLTSRDDKSQEPVTALNRFSELVKACGIEVAVSDKLPEQTKLNSFDYIIIDLCHHCLGNDLQKDVATIAATNNTILFNAIDDVICESTALIFGVKGVFYQSDRADIILKGLESIINQEYWFKRSTMNKAVTDLLKTKKATKIDLLNEQSNIVLPSLTKREKTIVHLVSSGAQNKEIAEQLHISPNTVKTHIYSLFRKTSSRNRIELITWTQQFHSTRPVYN